MVGFRRHITFLLCIIIIIALIGCAPKQMNDDRYIKLVPVDGEVYTVPAGRQGMETISIYLPTAEMDVLNREFREINLELSENKAMAVLGLLLKDDENEEGKEEPNEDSLYNPNLAFGGLGEVRLAIVSRSLAIVDITGDFAALSDQMIFASTVAVVNTLTELPEIDYVKLSINGVDQGSKGILGNPLMPMGDELRPLWLEHISYINTEAGKKRESIDRKVLYFLDRSGKFLLAEVRSSYHNTGNDISDIFQALKNGPANGEEMEPCVSKNVTIQGEPVIYENDEGQKTVTIALESPKHETMDNRSRFMIAGAMVLSIQGQRPDIDVVQILLNNEPIIDESRLTSEMFIEYIGNIVSVFFANESYDRLVPVKRAMAQERYHKPKERVMEVLAGVEPYDPKGVISVVIAKEQGSYIKDVSYYDGTAIVNLSYSFPYFTEIGIKTERMIIYSIVNTLCEFESISKVQFIVEGKRISSLGNLSVENPLLPNPGLAH